jgi:hypothetical protein
VILDIDNDRGLDLALTDEIADRVVLMRNTASTGVAESPVAGPLALRPNYPNPFRRSTRIEFELPEAGDVLVEIFDARGSLVARRPFGSRPAGRSEVVLEGIDAEGKPLSGGVYFYRLTAGGVAETGRMAVNR